MTQVSRNRLSVHTPRRAGALLKVSDPVKICRKSRLQQGALMRKTKILAALLASSALASPALAADMAPILKAPERAAVAPISGYLEMEAGFAWMRIAATEEPGGRCFQSAERLSGTGKVAIQRRGPGELVGRRRLSAQFDVWGGADDFGRGHKAAVQQRA